jgi:hypothetical protein
MLMDGRLKMKSILMTLEKQVSILIQVIQASLWQDHFVPGKEYKQCIKQKDVKIIMWDVISGDFDTSLDGNDCVQI